MVTKGFSLIFVSVFLVAFSARFFGLGSFMTVDESNWMLRSGAFWNNLAAGDLGGTFQSGHPGVVPMWIAGAGVFWQEHRLGYEIDQSNVHDFRLFALMPLTAAISLLIALISIQLTALSSWRIGLLSGLLLALAPYGVGMGQIVHVDMILALCMVSALLTACLLPKLSTKRFFLIGLTMTGLMVAMAMLTKFLPALFIWPTLAILFYFQTTPIRSRGRVRGVCVRLLFLLGVVGIVCLLLWPALVAMGNVTHYIASDATQVATSAHIDIEASGEGNAPQLFYVGTFFVRSLPFVLLFGFLVALWALWHVGKDKMLNVPAVLFLFSLLFLAFVTAVPKKADRYALPALLVWPILAAFTLEAIEALPWVSKWSVSGRNSARAVAAFLLLGSAVYSYIAWQPYEIAYSTPLFRGLWPLSQQGWGEGLDEAARALNKHPLADRLTVASWYPTVFEHYFKGKTTSLSVLDDPRVGFVVLYRNMMGRGSQDPATDIWNRFRDQKPWQVFEIGGQPYVWVYQTLGIPYFSSITSELLKGSEVGQTVRSESVRWSAVEVALVTYSGRARDGVVAVTIKEDADDAHALRTARRSFSEIVDNDWTRFSFEPIENVLGKEFYVSIQVEDAQPGASVAVKFSPINILPGDFYWRKQIDDQGKAPSAFLRPNADMAYRIVE